MKKIIIIGAVVIIIAGLAWFFMKDSTGPVGSTGQQVSKIDASDTVIDFYSQWLNAVKQPATANPDRATLAKSPILSEALRAKIKNAGTTPDPVLCQTKVPENISTRKVYVNADKAQVLVTFKDPKITEQATVTLIARDNGWYIDDIECSAGEFAPDREFSFESEGYLLKTSMPAPYNNKNWHLVYTEDGVDGNVIPLTYDSKSQCTGLDGVKSVCKPDQFTETTKVSVHGQMTERGVTVTRQELVK